VELQIRFQGQQFQQTVERGQKQEDKTMVAIQELQILNA